MPVASSKPERLADVDSRARAVKQAEPRPAELLFLPGQNARWLNTSGVLHSTSARSVSEAHLDTVVKSNQQAIFQKSSNFTVNLQHPLWFEMPTAYEVK